MEEVWTKKLKKDLHRNTLEEPKDQIHLSGLTNKWKESNKFKRINNSKVSLSLRFHMKWRFQEIVVSFWTKEEITILWSEERQKRHEKRIEKTGSPNQGSSQNQKQFPSPMEIWTKGRKEGKTWEMNFEGLVWVTLITT